MHDGQGGAAPLRVVRNEAAMMRSLATEHAAVAAGERTCCLVIVRPDGLEDINAVMLLAAIGESLEGCLRPYDGLFAYGPDRFLIVLPHINPEDTTRVMARLRERIAGAPLRMLDGGFANATASFGGAMVDGAVSMQDSIDRADQALFAAWRAGGNRTSLWTPHLDTR